MKCEQCGREFHATTCECGWIAPTLAEGTRAWKSPKTGVRYYLCTWSTGCHMPARTDPKGEPLCRWHRVCADSGQDATNHYAFKTWLDWLQLNYPSEGWWGWSMARLWPIVQGRETIIPERPALAGPTHAMVPARDVAYMSKEEFGLALFSAIKLASAMAWARQHAPERVEIFNKELQKLIPLITNPQDLKRLLALAAS